MRDIHATLAGFPDLYRDAKIRLSLYDIDILINRTLVCGCSGATWR